MKEHKMTKYDAGQDLIACADFLAVKEKDLFDGGFKILAGIVNLSRLRLGSAFNDLESHYFGLPDVEDMLNRLEKHQLENKSLKTQLEIAVEALKFNAFNSSTAREALHKIKGEVKL